MATKAIKTARRSEAKISLEEARALTLRAQGFGVAPPGEPIDVLDRIGAIQLDSVNALARSHELVPFSRIGVTPLAAMHEAIYRKRRAFEYWGHAASWLPIEDYRYFLPRMADYRERWRNVGLEHRELFPAVLERIRAEGALGTTDFEDPRTHRGSWWNWKPAKQVLEHLFAQGDLMCADRRSGFERRYDLPERVLPPSLNTSDPGPAEAARHLTRRAISALGVATGADAADYYRLSVKEWRAAVADLLEAGDIVAVDVEGWPNPAYACPSLLSGALDIPVHQPTFLSPFDNLIWGRDRTERVFGYRYRLEIYVPAPKRIYGYYVLPLLVQGDLRGRADLKLDRAAGVLRVRALWLEGAAPDAAVTALRHLASHLGAATIDVERVEPPQSRELIDRLLAS